MRITHVSQCSETTNAVVLQTQTTGEPQAIGSLPVVREIKSGLLFVHIHVFTRRVAVGNRFAFLQQPYGRCFEGLRHDSSAGVDERTSPPEVHTRAPAVACGGARKFSRRHPRRFKAFVTAQKAIQVLAGILLAGLVTLCIVSIGESVARFGRTNTEVIRSSLVEVTATNLTGNVELQFVVELIVEASQEVVTAVGVVVQTEYVFELAVHYVVVTIAAIVRQQIVSTQLETGIFLRCSVAHVVVRANVVEEEAGVDMLIEEAEDALTVFPSLGQTGLEDFHLLGDVGVFNLDCSWVVIDVHTGGVAPSFADGAGEGNVEALQAVDIGVIGGAAFELLRSAAGGGEHGVVDGTICDGTFA